MEALVDEDKAGDGGQRRALIQTKSYVLGSCKTDLAIISVTFLVICDRRTQWTPH